MILRDKNGNKKEQNFSVGDEESLLPLLMWKKLKEMLY